MPARYTVTVTVRRSSGRTPHGDPLPSTTHDIAGCFVAPSSGDSGQPASTERTDLRDTVITGWTLYAPFGADIQATDQVLLPGDARPWQVNGEVGRWGPSPFSNWKPGTQVSLRRVRG
jgi:hypothetical protein